MSKVEQVIQESNQTFRKENGMFKTTYYVGNVEVTEYTNYIEINDGNSRYGSPITDQALDYLRCVLDSSNNN